jgi:uncharacterized repeat protein (TIGR04052 family)
MTETFGNTPRRARFRAGGASRGRRALVLATLVTLTGCARPTKPAKVPITIDWKGHPLSCGKTDADPSFHLEDLRFFVHDLRLVDAAGKETPVELVADGRWQTREVSLLDFAPDCTDPRDSHSSVDVLLPEGQWKTLRFHLGVPFALNHANPATAEGPLAIGAMSWNWQAGYRFLKVEGHRGETAFRIHLGASQCEGTFAHVTKCGRPNIAEIAVPWTGGPLMLELTALIDEKGTQTDALSCMGESEGGCAHAYASLGLDLSTGAPASAQQAFLGH